MQIKDLVADAQDKGREKGLKGRRYRRFVEREFNKKAKKHIKIGGGVFKLNWGEKGVTGVHVVPRRKIGGESPVRNVPKPAPKGQAISSSTEGKSPEDHMGESV